MTNAASHGGARPDSCEIGRSVRGYVVRVEKTASPSFSCPMLQRKKELIRGNKVHHICFESGPKNTLVEPNREARLPAVRQ